MKFGLEKNIVETITSIFEQNVKVDKAIVFGSRAKGNYRPDSDIDVAIKGQDLTTNDIIKMNVAFEEKGIVYKIDLINYQAIKEPELKDHIDRVGIEFFSRWKEYKLTEMGTLKRGKSKHRPRYAFHLYGGPYPFIQTGEIREASKYITKYKQTYSEAGLAQSKLWHKGTLCITIAANIAEVAILSFDACFPDSVLGFVPDKNKCDLDFAFYTLKYFQRELQLMGDGSVQDNINLGTFEQIKFPFPPLMEQSAIASILSSLDDKIDLLHRQNETLEASAAALFRHWFVVEADGNWETMKISSVAKLNERTIDKNFNYAEIEYLDTGSITKGKIEQFQKFKLEQAPSRAQRLVSENDIVYSLVRPIQCHYGLMQEVKSNTVVSTGFCVISCDKISPYFVYLLLIQNDVVEYFDMVAEGSTSAYPSVKPSDIGDFEFQVPPDEIMSEFKLIAESNWRKIKSNSIEIRTLTQLRDTLLPKLMSGEVRVKL